MSNHMQLAGAVREEGWHDPVAEHDGRAARERGVVAAMRDPVAMRCSTSVLIFNVSVQILWKHETPNRLCAHISIISRPSISDLTVKNHVRWKRLNTK
jgi:hypothetical protein